MMIFYLKLKTRLDDLRGTENNLVLKLLQLICVYIFTCCISISIINDNFRESVGTKAQGTGRGDLTIPAAENIGKDKQKPRQPELDGPGMRINHVK